MEESVKMEESIKNYKDKLNIITIDGPAGSGKSTVAKMLSRELGLKYIDTGATYRTLTLLALQNSIEPDDEPSILKLAQKSKIELESNPKDESQYTIVRLNGKDVTDDIRSIRVGAAVSIVSKLSGIRKYLVSLQRELADSGGAVLEGRDTGSVVFPNALLKIYLCAGIEQRVRRRELQNIQNGQKVDAIDIKTEISTRDSIDSSRSDSPLIIPQDAIVIDNTNLTILETFEKIRDIYNERIRFKN
jgi:cytidylate kinase